MLQSRSMTGGMFVVTMLLSVSAAEPDFWEVPCYLVNGTVSKSDIRCSGDSAACCSPGWACMSNGLCSQGGFWPYQRHSCATSDWDSPTCPHLCMQGKSHLGSPFLAKSFSERSNAKEDGAASQHEYPVLCNSANDSSWCCNDASVLGNCCAVATASMFQLDIGFITATAPAMDRSWSSFLATYTPHPGDACKGLLTT